MWRIQKVFMFIKSLLSDMHIRKTIRKFFTDITYQLSNYSTLRTYVRNDTNRSMIRKWNIVRAYVLQVLRSVDIPICRIDIFDLSAPPTKNIRFQIVFSRYFVDTSTPENKGIRVYIYLDVNYQTNSICITYVNKLGEKIGSSFDVTFDDPTEGTRSKRYVEIKQSLEILPIVYCLETLFQGISSESGMQYVRGKRGKITYIGSNSLGPKIPIQPL